jgi:hypothetical protein
MACGSIVNQSSGLVPHGLRLHRQPVRKLSPYTATGAEMCACGA